MLYIVMESEVLSCIFGLATSISNIKIRFETKISIFHLVLTILKIGSASGVFESTIIIKCCGNM